VTLSTVWIIVSVVVAVGFLELVRWFARRRRRVPRMQGAGLVTGNWRFTSLECDVDPKDRGTTRDNPQRIERTLADLALTHKIHVASPLVRRTDTLSNGTEAVRWSVTLLLEELPR